MGIDSNSYNYRDFQQIWDPTGVNSLLGRTREACLRCRSKRSKCNGEEPCERCERAHEQCVYKRIRTSPHETKQLKESEPSKPAMTDTAGDYPSPPSSEDDGESKNAEDREHELGNDQAESQVVLFGGSQAKTPWDITLEKHGIRVDVPDKQHLYELLAHIARHSSSVHRGPATPSRPVGTHAMITRATIQWPRWHDKQPFHFSIEAPFPQDSRPLVISPEMEEILLDLILMKSVDCSASLPHKIVSERLFAPDHLQRPQPLPYMALRYAIGALNAQHAVLHHIDYAALRLPMHFNGSQLAARYFEKARALLVDQVLESHSDFCLETVDALYALVNYLVYSGQENLGSFYLGVALRVSTQLNYHIPLRHSPSKTVDVSTLEHAIAWNRLASHDHTCTAYRRLAKPIHTTWKSTQLNLLDIKLCVPADMPGDRLHRLQESLYMAKSTAICRDYLDTWWGDGAADPTAEDLERFISAFTRWSDELPPKFQLASLSGPYTTRASFSLAVNLQLHHHLSLIDLYYPFTATTHRNQKALPADLPRRAERACSDAAIMATRLVLTYMRAGGCSFPIADYPTAGNAHMRLAVSKDVVIARTHCAYVARARRIVAETREYELGKQNFIVYVRLLEKFMERVGIKVDEDAVLGNRDYFVPVRVQGEGW